jgi:hypothetical protein
MKYQYDDHETVASLARRWKTTQKKIRALIRRRILGTFGTGESLRITYGSVLYEEQEHRKPILRRLLRMS